MAKKAFIKDNFGNQILPITSSDNIIYVKDGKNVSLTSFLDNLNLGQSGSVSVNYREDIGNDRSEGSIGSYYISAPKDMITFNTGQVCINFYRFAGYDDHRGDDEYGLFPAPANNYTFLKSDGSWDFPKLDVTKLLSTSNGGSTGFKRDQLMFNHLYISGNNAKCRYVTGVGNNNAYVIIEQAGEGTSDGNDVLGITVLAIKLNTSNSNNVVKVNTKTYQYLIESL